MVEERNIPEFIAEEAREACLNLLPVKSKTSYDKEFADFNIWREKRGVTAITEDVLLAYFFNIKKKYAASSMWTKYSMVKATLQVYNNVDISKYGKLIAYLKSYSKTHKPKKAKVLERAHIEQFLKEAPEEKYLMMKVTLIFGVTGAYRCNELTFLTVNDVEDKGSYLFIKLTETKTNIARSFTVMDEGFSVSVINVCKKYMTLRPRNVSTDRFFLRYENGKCTGQPVGINTVSKIPSKVASFLGLPNAESYTGHCMRRSSATLLANAGVDITAIKRHGGWKSSSVAEGYIEDSVANKIEISKKIQGEASSKLCDSSTEVRLGSAVANDTEVDQVNKVFSFNINVNVNIKN